ncbi:MAG: hypothetical protein ACTHJT_11910 [Cytophaga sp.]|uniref:hypothetical protein n=1 Tax=Cytophaga sp. TaxID=29535 RepID=UPI003F821D71
MKKHFLILLITLFMVHTAGAAMKPFSEYIGKPGSSIKADISIAIEYRYDTLTTQFFICSFKYLNVFAFNDTIFKIVAFDDGSLFDEPCTLDTTYEDKVLLQKFEKYFTERYQVKPDYSTAPVGIFGLKQDFGWACPPHGGPTPLCARYFTLSDKANYSPAAVKRQLLNFDPNERLVGLLLYDKKPIEELASLAEIVRSDPFEFRYCYGCGNIVYPKTAKQISAMMKNLKK